MSGEPNLSWSRLLAALEDGLSEADHLGLQIVAARLSAIIEHIRGIEKQS